VQNKIKIVIADDNPNVRESLRDILNEKGYSIEVVNDGFELLSFLKRSPADLIILDLMMPQKDGVETLFSIKTLWPKIKVIIYTGFKRYENSICAYTADKFLLKGGSFEELLKAIKELS